MTTRERHDKGRWLRGLLVAAAAALPVVVAVPFVYMQAAQLARHDARGAAEVVMRQADAIFAEADRMAAEMAPLAGKSCAEADATLHQAAFQPYFRAVVLIRQRVLYCSSITEAFTLPLAQLLPDDEVPPGRSFHFVLGTPMVPDRSAVMAIRLDEAGDGVVVTVDGRYLGDLLDSVGGTGRYRIGIESLDGRHGLAGRRVGTPLPGAALVQEAVSTLYPFRVRSLAASALLAEYRRRLAVSYAPFVVLLALLLGYLCHHFLKSRFSLVAAIRRGMRRGEFEVHYQPVIDLRDGSCAGAEALMRWFRPGQGSVRPDLFFAVAESNGLAVPLTGHLFKLVGRDLRRCPLGPRFRLGLNITAAHLVQPGIVDDVARLRGVVGSGAADFVLEITEREPLPPIEQVYENMGVLSASGVKLAIDDFGTGHSSLACLERFPVDYLKIDRGFVSAIGTDAVNASVLEMIIGLAARLGVELTAEGVETREQRDYLAARGVHYAQGFLYARPMPIEALRRWMDEFHGAVS
ncbi:MAG: EAL domain-containing protein [Alcaligenaceae bacterium]|nr:EAL domain-containing protein [Alcaligenaceae bacterium SAGV5]MPS51531.1 EAL domain-containing protein [Alcaligenaceae bacterium SAGV3]MPT55544.1 EAL domain-containing protein [Alcaligenaceae bacterium]